MSRRFARRDEPTSRTPLPPPRCARTRAPKGSPRTFAKTVGTCRTTISALSPKRSNGVQSRDGADRRDALDRRESEAVPDHSRSRAARGSDHRGRLERRAGADRLAAGLARLKRAGVRTSLFIDPDAGAVERSHDLGADAIELHTGTYAHDRRCEVARRLATGLDRWADVGPRGARGTWTHRSQRGSSRGDRRRSRSSTSDTRSSVARSSSDWHIDRGNARGDGCRPGCALTTAREGLACCAHEPEPA